MAKRAIIAGASGLIGSYLLELLLDHAEYTEVLILVRKELKWVHPKLKQLVIDFDHLGNYKDKIRGDVLFCSLGSTRKKTPEIENYRKIDVLYPLELAKIGFENGIQQYHLITAMGADKRAYNFYSRLKGEVEEAIRQVPLKSIHFYRPSLLTGNRKEHRTGEKLFIKIMSAINPLLLGPFKKYRSIEARQVAKAMINQANKNLEGIYVYPSDKIQELGNE